MEELTARQVQVLDIINKYVNRGDPFPSLRELAAELRVNNKSGVVGHLRALERKGFVVRRSQRVSDFALSDRFRRNKKQGFPLVAVVPAGVPAPSFEQEDKVLVFDQQYFGGGDLKAVVISGESMAGDGICDGDVAIIKLTCEWTPQDIVAVHIEQDGVTLKRLCHEGDSIKLIPSNPAFSVRRVPAHQLEILGRLVGIIRKT